MKKIQISRRNFLKVMAAGATVGALSACGAASSASTAASATSSTASSAAGSATKEFTIACPAAGDTNPAMAEWWIWKEYEKQTGIHINWVEIPSSSMDDQKSLMMSSDDSKPDAFWQVTWTTDDLTRYGSQGAFVNIQPYLDSDAPNLKTALTKTVDGGLAACTMSDGGVYSMPWIMTDKPQMNLRYYLNKDWLDNLGLSVPTSVEELSAAFKAFKEDDGNKNGIVGDEYPIYYQPDGIGNLVQQLCGSYGIGNNGFKPMQEDYYIDANDKAQFLYTADAMKQIWQQMNEWWNAKYMQPDTFSSGEYEKWVTDGQTNDIVGMYGWGDAAFLYSDASQHYVGISALKGPNGDCIQSWCDFPVRSVSAFTITDKCADAEALIKWADYFYGQEGSDFAAYGKEGETYTKNASGEPVYCDDILNYNGGAQLGAWQYGFFVYGGNFPWLSYQSKTMEVARKQDSADYRGEKFSNYVADSEKYAAKLMPGMIPTLDEANEVAEMLTDIDTYVEEAQMNFVTGAWNFTSDWDAYVKQLQAMGTDRYMEIKNAQYLRYKQAQ